MKCCGLPKQIISLQIFQMLSSTNFIWSVLEYLDLYIFWRRLLLFQITISPCTLHGVTPFLFLYERVPEYSSILLNVCYVCNVDKATLPNIACYRIFWFHLELIISVSLTQTFQHSVQTEVCSYVTYQKLCHIYFCSIFQTVTLSKMTWQICLRL